MERDSKGLFLAGNTIGLLAKGVPKPSQKRNFKSVLKAVIESYSEEEIIALIKALPEAQQLHFLDSFSKSQQQHIQFMMKMQLEKEKLNGAVQEAQIITIRLPEEDSE